MFSLEGYKFIALKHNKVQIFFALKHFQYIAVVDSSFLPGRASAIPCRLLTYNSGVHIYDNYK